MAKQKTKILVIIPIKPDLSPELTSKAWALVQRLPASNPNLQFTIVVDCISEKRHSSDRTAWSKVTRIRNRILAEHDLMQYTHILWIDADVVDYPPDLPTILHRVNPAGVSAPMILIEGTDSFYDTAAFVSRSESGEFYNLGQAPPYWRVSPSEETVEMCGVGTLYLISTDIYLAGALHTDHPSFTDHWSICLAAMQMGRKITVTQTQKAWHAFLPKYGEAWH